MELRSLAPRRAAILIAMPLIVAPAASVPAHPATATASAARPPKPADNSIIPLPLVPIVPAARRLCANRTPSGLGYTMLRAAAGPRPAAQDTVLVNYIGYLAATGAVFDQGTRSPLPVGGVIPGFAQGLQLLSRSGVVRLCIPAALGYGDQAAGPIPAQADLVFQVELLDFKTAAELEELRKAAPGAPAADPAPGKPPAG